MEMKKSYSPFGSTSLSVDEVLPDIQTGRAVYPDKDKEADASYMERINSYKHEGFHDVSEDGGSSSGGGDSSSGGGTEPNSWAVEAEMFPDTTVSKNLVATTVSQGGTDKVVNQVVAYSNMTEDEILALDYIDVSAIEALDRLVFAPATSKVKPLATISDSVKSAPMQTSVAHLATDTPVVVCMLASSGTTKPFTYLIILPTDADVRYDNK